MGKPSLEHTMWPFQQHFRASMESGARKVVAALGAELAVRACLVGVRVENAADGNPVKASNSQQAPASEPANANAINLRPRSIMSSKPSALRFYLPSQICTREYQGIIAYTKGTQ